MTHYYTREEKITGLKAAAKAARDWVAEARDNPVQRAMCVEFWLTPHGQC